MKIFTANQIIYRTVIGQCDGGYANLFIRDKLDTTWRD